MEDNSPENMRWLFQLRLFRIDLGIPDIYDQELISVPLANSGQRGLVLKQEASIE